MRIREGRLGASQHIPSRHHKNPFHFPSAAITRELARDAGFTDGLAPTIPAPTPALPSPNAQAHQVGGVHSPRKSEAETLAILFRSFATIVACDGQFQILLRTGPDNTMLQVFSLTLSFPSIERVSIKGFPIDIQTAEDKWSPALPAAASNVKHLTMMIDQVPNELLGEVPGRPSRRCQFRLCLPDESRDLGCGPRI